MHDVQVPPSATAAVPVGRLAGQGPAMVVSLAGVGQLLATTTSVDAALDGVLRRVIAASGAEVAECFLREPQSGQMVLAALRGPQRAAFQQITRFRPGEGFPGLVAESGEPLVTADLAADPRYLRTAVTAAGYRSYLCVPLLGPGRVLGSLHVASRRRDESLVELLPVLAGVAGPLAVAVARDQAQIGERLAGVRVGPAADRAEALRCLARQILAEALATAGADGGMILWPSAARGALDVLALAAPDGAAPSSDRSKPVTVHCPMAADPATGPAVLCPGRAAAVGCGGLGFCDFVVPRFRVVVCLPLMVDERPAGQGPERLVGVICVGWRGARSMPTRSLAWLGRLAAAAASAFHHVSADAMPVVYAAAHDGRARDDVADDAVCAGRIDPRMLAATALEGCDDARGLSDAVVPAHRAPALSIRCLGGCTLEHRGVATGADVWGRPKFRRLFAYLLTERHRWVHREAIVDTFWPDLPLPAALHNLRVAIGAVRRALEPGVTTGAASRCLQRRGELYRLVLPENVWLDAAAFEQLSRPALERAELDDGAVAQLEAAVALYQGDYLPDDLYETWASGERQRLLDLYLTALDRLAAAWSSRRQYRRAVQQYRLLLARDPVNEAAHRGLMVNLAAAGRRVEALRQHDVCRELLRRELNVEPMAETTHLYRQLLAG